MLLFYGAIKVWNNNPTLCVERKDFGQRGEYPVWPHKRVFFQRVDRDSVKDELQKARPNSVV